MWKRKVQKIGKYFSLNVPTPLASLIGLEKGEEYWWGIDKDDDDKTILTICFVKEHNTLYDDLD